MSGGHFNYDQYKLQYIADEIEQVIRDNDSDEDDGWGGTKGRHYPDDIIDNFKTAIVKLKEAQIYAQRIDWLLSGDDGEECFRIRLREDLQKMREENIPPSEIPQRPEGSVDVRPMVGTYVRFWDTAYPMAVNGWVQSNHNYLEIQCDDGFKGNRLQTCRIDDIIEILPHKDNPYK